MPGDLEAKNVEIMSWLLLAIFHNLLEERSKLTKICEVCKHNFELR